MDGYIQKPRPAYKTTDKRGKRKGCPKGYYRTRKIRENVCALSTKPRLPASRHQKGEIVVGQNGAKYKVVAVKRYQRVAPDTLTKAQKAKKQRAVKQILAARNSQVARQARQLQKPRAPTSRATDIQRQQEQRHREKKVRNASGASKNVTDRIVAGATDARAAAAAAKKKQAENWRLAQQPGRGALSQLRALGRRL